jgi:phosphopantetheine--protein transferase-like protein
MLKLGNDIVDLSLPRAQLKHLEPRFLRFLARVFTKEEQSSILNANNNPKILWAIWAAKEAAYKALKKQLPELIFSHNKFRVEYKTLIKLQDLTETNKITGTLLYNNQLISINWQYSPDSVHCIAVLLNNQTIFNDWEKINYNIIENIENSPSLDCMKLYFTKRELASIFLEKSLKTRFYAKQFLKYCGFDPNIEIIRFNSNAPPTLFIGEQQLINNEISLSHDGKYMAVCCF